MESGGKVYRFPARKLQRIRRKVMKLSPFVEKKGWQKSPVSPMEILRLFSKLRIEEGYELIAYIFRSDIGGNGAVWEILEFGAFWHGLSWSLHEIVDTKPPDLEWHEDVEDLSPKVLMGEKVRVEFYTLSEFIVRAVYRHEDVYEGEMFEKSMQMFASGKRGYLL